MRSSLIESQTLSLSKLKVAPSTNKCVCTVRVWVCPDRIQLLFDQVECLSGSLWRTLFAYPFCCFFSWDQSMNNGVRLVGVPDVVDVLGEVIGQQHIVLQQWINEIFSWMSLNCSEIQEFIGWIRIHAVLNPFLPSSSLCQRIHSSFDCPLQSTNKFFL